MCGAYVTIVQGRATVPLEPRRDVVAGQVAAHAGRVLTYVLLGTLFGAAGGGPADLDRDGDCDVADFNALNQLMGTACP